LDLNICYLGESNKEIRGIRCLFFLDRISGNYLCFGLDKNRVYNLSLMMPNITSKLVMFIQQKQYNFTVFEGGVYYNFENCGVCNKPILYLNDILFFDNVDLRQQDFSSRLNILNFCLVNLKSKYIKEN
jgi:hypothetical protein